MRAILFSLPAFLLIGCVTPSVKEFKGPDGSSIKTVKCSSDVSGCFAEASASCHDGGTYRVLSSESHAGGLIADVMPGPVTWYSMTYSCGASDGQMPEFRFSGQQFVPPSMPVRQHIIVNQPSKSISTTCNKIGASVYCQSN
jgi:hypothetical protein